jgi:PQQ-dependent catabolism-associated CXXCW motif protein
MYRTFVTTLTTATVVVALLLLQAAPSQAQGLTDEERDWGVVPSTALKPAPYTAPTPIEIPGARSVRTDELKRLLAAETESARPLLFDVASGEGHVTLAGGLWWPGVGRGANFLDTIQGEVATRLEQVTGGKKTRPLAFYCVNSQCWLSYNASLRAVALGYTRVLWYRGGVEAWRAAGLPLGQVRQPWAAAVPMMNAGDAEKPR